MFLCNMHGMNVSGGDRGWGWMMVSGDGWRWGRQFAGTVEDGNKFCGYGWGWDKYPSRAAL